MILLAMCSGDLAVCLSLTAALEVRADCFHIQVDGQRVAYAR